MRILAPKRFAYTLNSIIWMVVMLSKKSGSLLFLFSCAWLSCTSVSRLCGESQQIKHVDRPLQREQSIMSKSPFTFLLTEEYNVSFPVSRESDWHNLGCPVPDHDKMLNRLEHIQVWWAAFVVEASEETKSKQTFCFNCKQRQRHGYSHHVLVPQCKQLLARKRPKTECLETFYT